MSTEELALGVPDGYDDDQEDDDDVLVEGDDIFYKAGDIAKQLGISRDMVRYFTNKFPEHLNVVKTKEGKGGHARYRGEDLETLSLILGLHKQHKTVAEIKVLLNLPGVSRLISNVPDADKATAALLLKNNEYLIEGIKEIIRLNQETYLEEKATYVKDVERLTNEVKELRGICEHQTELINKVIENNEDRNIKKGFLGLFRK